MTTWYNAQNWEKLAKNAQNAADSAQKSEAIAQNAAVEAQRIYNRMMSDRGRTIANIRVQEAHALKAKLNANKASMIAPSSGTANAAMVRQMRNSRLARLEAEHLRSIAKSQERSIANAKAVKNKANATAAAARATAAKAKAAANKAKVNKEKANKEKANKVHRFKVAREAAREAAMRRTTRIRLGGKGMNVYNFEKIRAANEQRQNNRKKAAKAKAVLKAAIQAALTPRRIENVRAEAVNEKLNSVSSNVVRKRWQNAKRRVINARKRNNKTVNEVLDELIKNI